jgi:hypothetical protein
MRLTGHLARYNISIGKPDEKRPLVRPRRRWEDSIRMDLRLLGKQGGKVWTECLWLRKESSCEHGNEISGSIKGAELLD